MPDVVPKVALEITVEHVAKEAIENQGGELVESGSRKVRGCSCPLIRQWSMQFSPISRTTASTASSFYPPEGPLGPYPPTDGGDWYPAGVPLVNFISNPVYLLNAEDDFHWVWRAGCQDRRRGSGDRRGDGEVDQG